MTEARDLADRYHQGWLAAHPFSAARLGVPDFDGKVPDASEAGDERRGADLDALRAEATAVEAPAGSDDAVTLGCLIEALDAELAELDSAPVEHTVTPMQYSGPAVLLATVARTPLPTPEAAAAYLERLRAAGTWIDQISDRLRAGAAKSRVPVSSLVEQSVEWVDGVLASPVPEAVTAPAGPSGWDGLEAWEAERDAVATDVLGPALARWRDTLAALLPQARSDEHVGLTHLPGGDDDYRRAIQVHTTLPLTAEELHRTGMEELGRLEARSLELGAALGYEDLPSIYAAMRKAAADADPLAALAAAQAVVRRAEQRAHEVFPSPLPPPCAVSPMPPVVATSGAAPHYSPPRLDGGMPGTYWFNTMLPTAGTGWDLEGVAFHEAVPGHHLQLSRVQMLGDLPAFQRQRSVTVFAEGWGLYAEQLAEEMGLYSGTEALLGAMANALIRAARLVVDTGVHALGWSRRRALDFFVQHVPMPEAFLANEIDRYIAWPGQALAYLTGKLVIVRLRDEARTALGDAFELPAFHATVLDHGSLPMPVLEQVVQNWAASAA